ncbi:MAG: ribbon-helix-helix protein, CopG family [bacterium]
MIGKHDFQSRTKHKMNKDGGNTFLFPITTNNEFVGTTFMVVRLVPPKTNQLQNLTFFIDIYIHFIIQSVRKNFRRCCMTMMRVNIVLPETLLITIDELIKQEKINRSEFFRKAARLYEQVRKEKEAKRRKKEAIKKAILIQNELRESTSNWDGVAELQRQREVNK